MLRAVNILCIGAAHWDVVARAAVTICPGDDVPGKVENRPGGVALNIAMALAAGGMRPVLLAALGRDVEGQRLIDQAAQAGIDCGYLTRTSMPTDRFVCVEAADGTLALAVADCRSLDTAAMRIGAPLTDGSLASNWSPWRGIAVFDGNLAGETIALLAASQPLSRAELVFCAASPAKAPRLEPVLRRQRGTFYLNRLEAEALLDRAFPTAADAAQALRDAGARTAFVTDGPAKVAYATNEDLYEERPPPTAPIALLGAGDRLVAAHLIALSRGLEPGESVETALRLATKLQILEHAL